MNKEQYEDIKKAIDLTANECINFTAEQRDNLMNAVKGRFNSVDKVQESLLERIENVERMLFLTAIALSAKSGQPMEHEAKVGLANELHIDWEGTIKDITGRQIH